mmetsp:Transcript_51809/g.138229  ORF Transcript_51809/g.138229 Transcript_51809/m.138229 type:complete len:367 (-) Transcript_51809:111-1211(-)
MISVLWGIIVSAEAMYFSDHRALHVAFPRDDFLGFRPPPGLEGQAGPRLADEIRENRTVHVPMCYGRMGNHLYQFARLAFFAEVMNATALFPRRNSCIMDMFAFPERLEVLRSDPEFLSRVHCDVDGSWDGVHCTGQKRSDYVRVFRQYVLPYLVQEGQEVCDVEAGNTRRELTIHMRSGDLLIHTDHPQSRFAPCVFFEKVAHDFNFTRLRIITEPDMAHPCIEVLQRSPSPFEVTVQSKSEVEDACALMYAKHLAVGAMSTFSIALHRFSPHATVQYDPFGPCPTENTTEPPEIPCSSTRSVSYCVDGIHQIRWGEDKVQWMLNYDPSTIRKTQEMCDSDCWVQENEKPNMDMLSNVLLLHSYY